MVRTATVVAVLYALIVAIIILPIIVIAVLLGASTGGTNGGFFAGVGLVVGLLIGLLVTFFYAAIGWIFAALACLLYNLAARWVGGIEVSVEAVTTTAPPLSPTAGWGASPPTAPPSN